VLVERQDIAPYAGDISSGRAEGWWPLSRSARHFGTNNELVELLTKDHDADEGEIRALVQQVEEKGYTPPRREKILEYQSQLDFPICPDPDDPDACNPYAELLFPDEVYEAIQE
jgi:hypothetical protein